MLLCSGYLNSRFAMSKAQSLDAAIVYATIGVAAEVFCFTLPFFFIPALRRFQLFRAIVGMVIWAACIAFSAQSAIGHVAGSRFEALSGRTAAATSYQDTREELKRARERMSWLPRPSEASGALQAKIKNMQGNLLFTQTNECANQWTPAAKQFCAKLAELSSALTNSLEYEKLDRRITELQAKSDAAGGAHVNILTEGADPQATALGKWFGVDVATMQGLLSLGVAVLLLLASLVPYAILGGGTPSKAALPSEPAAGPALSLSTEDRRVIDITPSAPQKAAVGYLPSPRDLSPEAKQLLRAIGIPDKPCDKREKDGREVLGYRFFAWLIANGYTGDFSPEQIDEFYAAYTTQDNRTPWDAMRVVKSELSDMGARYVTSGLRVKEDGSRGTVWTIRQVSFARLTEVLRKRGVIPKDMPPPEPEPAVEATAAPRNVFKLFGRGSDDEPKKATNG